MSNGSILWNKQIETLNLWGKKNFPSFWRRLTFLYFEKDSDVSIVMLLCLFEPTTSRGAWSISSKRIQWPLVTAWVSVPGCHTNFPGMSVQRYIPSSICQTHGFTMSAHQPIQKNHWQLRSRGRGRLRCHLNVEPFTLQRPKPSTCGVITSFWELLTYARNASYHPQKKASCAMFFSFFQSESLIFPDRFPRLIFQIFFFFLWKRWKPKNKK